MKALLAETVSVPKRAAVHARLRPDLPTPVDDRDRDAGGELRGLRLGRCGDAVGVVECQSGHRALPIPPDVGVAADAGRGGGHAHVEKSVETGAAVRYLCDREAAMTNEGAGEGA